MTAIERETADQKATRVVATRRALLGDKDVSTQPRSQEQILKDAREEYHKTINRSPMQLMLLLSRPNNNINDPRRNTTKPATFDELRAMLRKDRMLKRGKE